MKTLIDVLTVLAVIIVLGVAISCGHVSVELWNEADWAVVVAITGITIRWCYLESKEKRR